ncbi:YbfB/YjiJ family MFS transporter [aff. Roholtiella sp. LEGE 12411]|uniref:YbfB/YjiJ family MFS transporter n=1 Tax=aff. Roholtiella sp. LEGE 12411 TaxID=1828822 RepID=UPI00187FD4CE|nr:YbfB/YjiJ family MFS transporter [aff. Roholtiella sp. LEGE 12411]MBE9033594.1 YbfB/YjiJ family MFS transporter [aff. Roholtiella sp. LEGE 12411]
MGNNIMMLWQARILGCGATFVGVGVTRMAFTPLAAMAVSQGLWTANAPSKIGAFLLIGYAFGAVMTPWLLKKLGTTLLLKVSLFFISTGLIFELGYKTVESWLVTRSILGFCGACLMVCGPSLALKFGTPSERNQTQLWTFMGIGLGACVSASLLEFRAGLIAMLVPIVLFCLLFFALSLLWLKSPLNTETTYRIFSVLPPKTLIIAYALDAIAYIPATVYLSDYVTNELGLHIGNILWQLFGLGAIIGPWIATALSKKIGSSAALNLIYVFKTFALLILAWSQQVELLAIGSMITGVCVPAIVLLTASEIRRTLEDKYFSSAWSLATLVFASAQALGAMVMALCFQLIKTYQPIFLGGALLLFPACYLTLQSSRGKL